jgi:hypothetical protein
MSICTELLAKKFLLQSSVSQSVVHLALLVLPKRFSKGSPQKGNGRGGTLKRPRSWKGYADVSTSARMELNWLCSFLLSRLEPASHPGLQSVLSCYSRNVSVRAEKNSNEKLMVSVRRFEPSTLLIQSMCGTHATATFFCLFTHASSLPEANDDVLR